MSRQVHDPKSALYDRFNECNFRNLRKVGHVYKSMNTRSELMPDLDFKQFVPPEYVGTWLPAPLNREALYLQLPKYDLDPPKYCEKSFKRAVKWMRHHFAPFLRNTRPIPLAEAVALQTLSTSPGPLYRKYYEDKGKMIDDDKGLLAIIKFSDLMKEVGGCDTYWGGCLKDELRPKFKVDANKTRLFTSCSAPMCVATAEVCHDFNRRFFDSCLQTSSCVGVSKFNGGFDRMYSKLSKFSHGDEWDGTNFDGSLFKNMFWEIAQFRCECFQDNVDFKYLVQLCNIYDNIIQSRIILSDGLCVEKQSGNPSGSFNTIVDNTLANFLIFAYLWVRLGRNYDSFCESVSLLLVGDDNTFTISDDAIKGISRNQCLTIIAELGFVYSSPHNDFLPYPKLSFLSHSVFNDCGMWLPRLQDAKLWCSAYHSSSRNRSLGFKLLRLCALRIEGFYCPGFYEAVTSYIEKNVHKIKHTVYYRFVNAGMLSKHSIVSLYRGDESVKKELPGVFYSFFSEAEWSL